MEPSTLELVLDWLTTDKITALGVAAIGLLTAWTSRLASRLKTAETKVAELERQGEKDRDVIKAAARYIRDQALHIAILCGLLRQHAPSVDIPPEPKLPAELENEV